MTVRKPAPLNVTTYPTFPESLPKEARTFGHYTLRFAQAQDDLAAITRLRYRVFNLELGEGFDRAHATGHDEDQFDATCHHLTVIDNISGQVIGTYRLQTSAMAAAHGGFYSAGEFDLAALPADLIDGAVEAGRACIAQEHRNQWVLFLLWRGLADYLMKNQKRCLFGCSSLTSQDPIDGTRMLTHLTAQGFVHPRVSVTPRAGLECISPSDADAPSAAALKIPKLFEIYLKYGAKVCGPPAIDRDFKTIDFFTLLEVANLPPAALRTFFDGYPLAGER